MFFNYCKNIFFSNVFGPLQLMHNKISNKIQLRWTILICPTHLNKLNLITSDAIHKKSQNKKSLKLGSFINALL